MRKNAFQARSRDRWVTPGLLLAGPVLLGLALGTASAASKTHGRFEAFLCPLVVGTIVDSNVGRVPGGKDSDVVASFATGAEAVVLPAEGDTWQGRLEVGLAADRYLQHPRLSNLTNVFSLSAGLHPRRLRFLAQKTFRVRRSRWADLDYWDDLYHGEGRLSLGKGLSALLRYDYQVRLYSDKNLEYQARRNRLGLWGAELEADLCGPLRATVALERSRQDFNRCALAMGSTAWWILPEIQRDTGWAWEAGLRLYAGKVLQQLLGRDARVLSNSYGCAYRARSLTWAAVWKNRTGLLVEMKARVFEKRYDLEPLGLPEYGLGWLDEEGQSLASFMARQDFKKHWAVTVGYTWLESESGRPGWFYRKQKGSLRISRSF